MRYHSDYYNEDYFAGKTSSFRGGYKDEPEKWDKIAELILKEYPDAKTILELGCAYGFLVKRLRAAGRDAYGVEFSKYALDNLSSEVRPYVYSLDLNDRFIGRFRRSKFDLICSFDVLEHIDEEYIDAVVRECSIIGKKNFHQVETKSLPGDNDATHVNIKPIDYWQSKCKGWKLIESRA